MLPPGLLDDPDIAGLTNFQFRVFLAVYRLAYDDGRLVNDPAWIASRAFSGAPPPRVRGDEVVKALLSLAESRVVRLYRAHGRQLVQVLKWPEVKNPSVSVLPGPEEEPVSNLHSELMDKFRAEFLAVHKVPYKSTAGKGDDSALGRFLRSATKEEVALLPELWGMYIRDREPFLAKQGYSLSFFFGKTNQFMKYRLLWAKAARQATIRVVPLPANFPKARRIGEP